MSKVVWILLFNLLSLCPAQAKEMKNITLVTHSASPFMDEKLPDGGAIVYGLRLVLKEMNYSLKVVFVPSWTRAKMIANKDDEVDGYFPYATIEDEKKFEFSHFFIQGPWVIIERKDSPIRWNKVEDLTKYTAGNVTGVELRSGVKELVEQKKLRVETTATDTFNLMKLATKRVDLVFMDEHVFKYRMATEPALQKYKNILQVNAKPLTISQYGLAVKKKNVDPDFIKTFNKVSASMEKHILDYIHRMSKEATLKEAK